MTYGTDEALQLLAAGWTVRYCEAFDSVEWRSPDGISGSGYHSSSLDQPPPAVLVKARRAGQIIDRPRTTQQL